MVYRLGGTSGKDIDTFKTNAAQALEMAGVDSAIARGAAHDIGALASRIQEKGRSDRIVGVLAKRAIASIAQLSGAGQATVLGDIMAQDLSHEMFDLVSEGVSQTQQHQQAQGVSKGQGR